MKKRLAKNKLLRRALNLSLRAQGAQDLADDLNDQAEDLADDIRRRIKKRVFSTGRPRLDCEIEYSEGPVYPSPDPLRRLPK